jgi:hypothetical protein
MPRFVIALLVVVIGVVTGVTGGVARADAPKVQIALLPLDADAKVEVYSQPVASELARALTQGGYDVIVIGVKMSVPKSARLVVDGTIRIDKTNAVSLTARIRAPEDLGKIVPVDAPATTKTMDHAAEDLSAKLLAAVKTRIAELDAIVAQKLHDGAPPPPDKHEPLPPTSMQKLLLAAVTINDRVEGAEVMRTALAHALPAFAQKRHHELKLVDKPADTAQNAVIKDKADFAISCEIVGFGVKDSDIPLAWANVHVRVTDVTGVVWSRELRTNTVVGDKGLANDKLAERVAREVLQILDPHLVRKIGSWR